MTKKARSASKIVSSTVKKSGAFQKRDQDGLDRKQQRRETMRTDWIDELTAGELEMYLEEIGIVCPEDTPRDTLALALKKAHERERERAEIVRINTAFLNATK